MKANLLINAFSSSAGPIICFLLLISVGCSKSSSKTESIAQEPKGELIQGEPITPDPEPLTGLAMSAGKEANEETLIIESNSTEIVIETTELPIASSTSNTTTQSTSQVMMSASQPEVLLEVVKEELPLLEGEYASISFDKLASFDYTMPEDLTEPVADDEGQVYKEQIPAPIKALNGQNISLKGFMLPLKVEKSLVTEMLIMRDQSMCCYGTVPKINEWVSVRMEEKGVKPIMDEPVTIFGTLKVGEVLENGYLVGIYEMDGQSMTAETSNN